MTWLVIVGFIACFFLGHYIGWNQGSDRNSHDSLHGVSLQIQYEKLKQERVKTQMDEAMLARMQGQLPGVQK